MIVAPAVPVETVKLVEEVPAFIVVMEFGRAPIKDKDLFCGECGYKLEEINEQKVKKETTKRKQKRSLKSFDYISALGLTEDFDESQLKKAYRREARKWHPDLNKNDKNAEAQFMLVNEAYEFLNKQLEREEDKKNY